MNEAYAESFKKSIKNATSCEALGGLLDRVVKYQTDMLKSITDQLAILEPLIEAPGANLTALAEWAENVAGFFLGPYNALLLAQAETIALVAELTALLNSKSSELGCVLTAP